MWSVFGKDAKGVYWSKKDSLQQMVLEQLDARMLKMTFRPVVHTVHKNGS